MIGWMIIILVSGFDCARKKESEKILAAVGNQTLTVEEFKLRTELTLRPRYPALSDEDEKQLYLNNLIAEKLMAREGYQGEQEKRLIDNPVFQAQIRGIQEQSMRENLFMDLALKPVHVDSTEIQKVFALSGREYKVSFFSIHNDSLAGFVRSEIRKDPKQFENLFYENSPSEKIAQKTIKFRDPDPVVVHDSLFSKSLDVGQVIGPLQIEDNYYLLIKVDDWTYYPAVSEQDFNNRWAEVEKKLEEKKSIHTWRKYIAKVMKGKSVEFEEKTFLQMARIFFNIYGTRDKVIKNNLLKDFISTQGSEIRFDNQNVQSLMLDQPFFTLDGEVWTVRDFREAYMSHPLVFKNDFSNFKSFQREFHAALLDLIRDHYLTKEAYKRKLDQSPDVQRTTAMWKDAYVAAYHRDRYLSDIAKRADFDPDMMKGRINYLSLYVDSLQDKYQDKIKIDFNALRSIKLSDIDLYAIKPDMPYQAAAPGFPEYTQESKLDYARPIEKKAGDKRD